MIPESCCKLNADGTPINITSCQKAEGEFYDQVSCWFFFNIVLLHQETIFFFLLNFNYYFIKFNILLLYEKMNIFSMCIFFNIWQKTGNFLIRVDKVVCVSFLHQVLSQYFFGVHFEIFFSGLQRWTDGLD